MRSLIIIISFVFLINGTNLYGQESNIQRKWYQNGTSGCQEEDGFVNPTQKLALEFNEKDSVRIWTSNFWQVDAAQNGYFELNGSNLTLGQRIFEVLKTTPDTLIIQSNIELCEKLLFISENRMYREQLRYYTLFENDTLYFPNKFNYPMIEENKSYDRYLTSESSIVVVKNRSRIKAPCNFKFKFIITSEGQIKRPTGSVDCLKKDQKFIHQTIEKSRGKWTPMYINGEAVNTLIDFKFKHNVPQTFRNY